MVDIQADNFNSSTSEFTGLTATHTWDSTDYTAGQLFFAGWEYQLELRDNSDGTGTSLLLSQSAFDFETGAPIVAVDTGESIETASYVAPSASITLI